MSLDPGWAPDRASVALRPVPNTFTPVVVALNRTREVMGTVERVVPIGRTPLAAATLEIVNESGHIAATVRTFHDGVFDLERMRPGSYVLRLGPATAAALGAAGSVELPFEVASRGGDVVELPTFLIPAAG